MIRSPLVIQVIGGLVGLGVGVLVLLAIMRGPEAKAKAATPGGDAVKHFYAPQVTAIEVPVAAPGAGERLVDWTSCYGARPDLHGGHDRLLLRSETVATSDRVLLICYWVKEP